MKVRNSLKSLRGRHRDNRLVRRKGRVYVINKTQKRFKARQGLSPGLSPRTWSRTWVPRLAEAELPDPPHGTVMRL